MGRKEEAAAKRQYAKEQGALARDFRSGRKEPQFYIVEDEKGGRKVKVACDASALTEEERKRQINEAARYAEDARREANKEAAALESK